MAEDGGCRWLLSTTAVPASVGDLGKKVEVDLGDYHLVGLYLLTSDEVRLALSLWWRSAVSLLATARPGQTYCQRFSPLIVSY